MVGGCLVRHNWSSIVVSSSCFIEKESTKWPSWTKFHLPTWSLPTKKNQSMPEPTKLRFHGQHLKRVRFQMPFCILLIQGLFHATVSFKSGPALFSEKGSFLLSTARGKKYKHRFDNVDPSSLQQYIVHQLAFPSLPLALLFVVLLIQNHVTKRLWLQGNIFRTTPQWSMLAPKVIQKHDKERMSMRDHLFGADSSLLKGGSSYVFDICMTQLTIS